MKRTKFILTIGSVWLGSALSGLSQTAFERECAELAASKAGDTGRLHALFKLDWEHSMKESPEWATEVGYPGQNDRWSDLSEAAIERRKHEVLAPLNVIKSINRSKLSAADRLSYDIFERNAEEDVEARKFPSELEPVNQLGGVQQEIAAALSIMPTANVRDYENILARLSGTPKLIEQNIALLRRGLAVGVTPPRITLRDVPQQVLNQIVDDPKQSALMRPFKEFPLNIAATEQERLRSAAWATITNQVYPALRELHKFLAETYVPGARESIACIDLPNGRAWYAFNVRQRTTTRLTPQQIHALGLSEVKRIRTEMAKVIATAGFKGSFQEFLTFLRTDKQFYYERGSDLITGYRDVSKRVDAELPKLFGKLPRLPYGVIAIPSYAEKSQTTAYYQPGAPAFGRPGFFYANTYALDTRPKWEMEALTLHEAVPGHHLQIALAQELEGVPDFRKHDRAFTAFVEGWGLYSESLGEEMGFYRDPYSKFGQLTYEIWRAIRLVVDTGMHSMGWTRQQAIDFFKENAGKTEHDIVVEVDRYIVWPGQALAYKIGELKIKELRAYATKELGEKFDVRAFHDELLGSGPLPLDVLETRLKAWVAEQKKK